MTADISGAKDYGIVVDGAKVNVTSSKSITSVMTHTVRTELRSAAFSTACHLLLQRRKRNDQRQPGLQVPKERDHGQRQGRQLRRSLHPQDIRLGDEQHRDRRGRNQLHRPERHPDQLRRERRLEQEAPSAASTTHRIPLKPVACFFTRPAESTSRTTRSPATR